ncbi:MAG TPA: response regulator [Burkholderiaceae bacterium]|nr:response regulator [Burkholderiaceae bacterium]
MAVGAVNDREPAAQSVLVVDDVSMNLEIITSQLAKRGYITLVARSGQEAVERAELARPDLILLDVLMPGINGFETCRRLKQREATRDIPVIFMTALTAIDDKIEGFSVGAVDYVTKPINAEEVATRVVTHLKLDALRRRQAAQNRQLRQEIAAREQDMRSKREEAREEERKHIARELHDELGQHLSAIRLELSFVRMRWGTDNPELREKVQSVQQSIDGVIGVVRDLVARLRPVVLDMGIATALKWLVCEFRTSSEVKCDLQIDEQVADLSPWQTSIVFRLVQESLTNIGRHAHAHAAQVSLRRQPHAYVLTVSDDGLGFDPTKIGIKSLGLQGMRERARMLDGRLDLRTRPGEGTSIVVEFPIEPPGRPDHEPGELT